MAASVTGAQTAPWWSSFVLMALVFVLLWFFMIRPQTRKLRQHQNLVSSLQRGDKILTHSGIIGKITKIQDNVLYLQVAPNVEITIDKNYVAMRYDPQQIEKKEKSVSKK